MATWLLAAAVWAADTRPVEVRVLDEDGSPAAATISVKTEDAPPPVDTDAGGRATIVVPDPTPAGFSIRVRRDDGPGVDYRYFKVSGEVPQVPDALTVRLRAPVEIGGTVFDAEGVPVAGASVDVWAYTGDQAAAGEPRVLHRVKTTVATDVVGGWSASMPEGESVVVNLEINAEGFVRRDDQFRGEALEGLRSRAATATLTPGYRLPIRVRGPHGRPVAGVLLKYDDDPTDGDQTRTDADGRAVMPSAEPGRDTVVAVVRGYAPASKSVEVRADVAEVDMTLDAGSPIVVEVVDPDGKPAAGVRFGQSSGESGMALMSMFREVWDVRTDANGRWEWPDAPPEGGHFFTMADGYSDGPMTHYTPRDEPYRITLTPKLEVTVAATDAETGRPVEGWTLVPGIAFDTNPGPYWQRDREVRVNGGQFTWSPRSRYAGHYVKVESEGFEPFLSKRIAPDAGGVRVDAKLKPADVREVRVVNAAGEPAADAELIFATPSDRIYVREGGVVDRESGRRVRADASGIVRPPAMADAYWVFSLGPAGFAAIADHEFEAAETLTLTGWSTLEGTFLRGGEPAANVLLQVEFTEDHPVGWDRKRPATFDYDATTDVDGRYRFTRVPPGPVRIAETVPRGEVNRMFETAARHHALLFAIAGENLDWDFPEPGALVRGRLNVPEGVRPNVGESILASAADGRTIALRVEPGGDYAIPDVPPGEYVIRWRVNRPPYESLHDTEDRFAVDVPVVVPEGATTVEVPETTLE